MFIEYILIYKYFFFCFLLSFVLFVLSFVLVVQKPNVDKISIYECGFNPFGDSRNKFEVKFYVVAILFIVFDLEIIFLFPWLLIFFNLNIYGFFSMILFLFILFFGFIYEWIKGALDW